MPYTLAKAKIIDTVAEANGFRRKDAVIITETLIKIIKRVLESGDDILYPDSGNSAL